MTARNKASDSPTLVVVAYKPLPGKEAALLALTKKHIPILREQGLVTDRPPYAMYAGDGTIIEIFEWRSESAIDSAHKNPAVLQLWEEYGAVCEIVPLNKVTECSDLFAGFEPIDLRL